MATSESLAALEWLARVYAPQLLTLIDDAAEAAQIRGTQSINNVARMRLATDRLATLEAQCWAEHVPAWDAFWPVAGEYVFDQVIAQNTTAIATCIADPDIEVRLCLKTGLRALEMAALRFAAGGGVLP